PCLLRPGLIGVAELEAVLGPLGRPAPAGAGAGGALPAPGMLPRHYAPRTPLECVEAGWRERAEALCAEGLRVGLVATGPSGEGGDLGLVIVGLPADPAGYAARLYAGLHDLDEAGLDRIVVALPPDTPAWLAVRDRLRRASFEG